MPPLPDDIATINRAAVRARLRALALQRSMAARTARQVAAQAA